jgi:ribonucleoside-diphosphate reductase alpha chain
MDPASDATKKKQLAYENESQVPHDQDAEKNQTDRAKLLDLIIDDVGINIEEAGSLKEKVTQSTPFDSSDNKSDCEDDEIDLSPNAKTVIERRYLKKDEDGNIIEGPGELFKRVAFNIASADKAYDPGADIEEKSKEFYQVMTNLEFLPNSPTLMNAGRELQQLSACFVLPIEDSMDAIFETVKNTALIHKSGGGTGFSFSRLRPKKSRVKTTKGVSSGPVSFMGVFDAATETIKQGGTRRGANMAILRIDHPDILEFITSKKDSNRFNNFNISVAITEDFLKKVENDEEYELIDPHTKKARKKLQATKVFDLIVNMAWKNGDPGIIFLDRINRDNPTPHIGEIESTNPCGEQPLLPYESCNLGSINLSKMVITNNGERRIDYSKLAKTVRASVQFLDNVIDKNNYPLEVIEKNTKGNRKIGLGVMGFADALIKLGIPYNSDMALQTAEKVMEFIQKNARETSKEIASKRGAFPNIKGSLYDRPECRINIRNATTTTIAPTGTLSIIANCSSGIEPLFAISYIRKVLDNDELIEVHPLFEEVAKQKGFYGKELMKKIAEKGSLQGIKEVPEDIQKLFMTAHDVDPEWHIKMQATFQKYTDNAVSKTVNLRHDATTEDVKNVYLLAYKLGCKGVTIYRDASRDVQVLNIDKPKQQQEPSVKSSPKPRPEMTKGTTRMMRTGCGKLYVTINEDIEGKPFEIFNQMGKAGGCSASQSEAIGRLVSLALRSSIDVKEIITQIKGISCHLPVWQNGNKVLSCADAIAKALEHYINTNEATSQESLQEGLELKVTNEPIMRGSCPDCGGIVEHESGCLICKQCGYSECY